MPLHHRGIGIARKVARFALLYVSSFLGKRGALLEQNVVCNSTDVVKNMGNFLLKAPTSVSMFTPFRAAQKQRAVGLLLLNQLVPTGWVALPKLKYGRVQCILLSHASESLNAQAGGSNADKSSHVCFVSGAYSRGPLKYCAFYTKYQNCRAM